MNDIFSGIYESIYYSPNFSQAVLTQGLYTSIGLVMLFVATAFFFFTTLLIAPILQDGIIG